VEVLSYIVLILLSLVGYSGGATGRAGKGADLKPVLLDLILVSLIWASAIYSRLTLDFNKWLLILVWLGIAAAVGWGSVFIRRLRRPEKAETEDEHLPSSQVKRLWARWSRFSKRMGSFQSRVMLSFFFFIFITPAALAIKMLGDPLQIKKKKVLDTYWLAKSPGATELEDFRRQF
jgi:hypothetical protein